MPSTPSLVYASLCLGLPLGKIVPSCSVNKHSYYKALAQRKEPIVLLEWWQTANVPSDLGLRHVPDEGAVLCVAELPLGAPSAATSPLIPAALRGTGKDSLKF